MTGSPALDPDLAAEPDPGPAHQAGDPGPAVEQRGQVAGGVADLAGQHRVPLHRTDLDHPHPALDGGLARLVDRADRGDVGRRDRPVVTAGAGQRLGLGLGRGGGGQPRPSGAAARRPRRAARGRGSATRAPVPSRTAWRSCSTCSRFCTSNGMIVAAAFGTRLTTPAILSAVRSCSSRPSSEKLRRGRIAVTCVPGASASWLTSSAAHRVSLPVGAVDELERDAAVRQPGGAQPLRLLAVDDEVHGAHRGGPQALRVPQRGQGGQVEVVDEDDDDPAGVVRLARSHA